METIMINTKIVKSKLIPKKNIMEMPLENSYINTLSYIDMTPRKVYINNKLNNGSYNTIYNISVSNKEKSDSKLILRLSNNQEPLENIKMELRGIKKQYDLSQLNPNIGLVIDYGRLIYENDYFHREYSILQRYGVSLKFILESKNIYSDIMVPLNFIKKFLKAIHIIHKKGNAHLDLKPSNILMKNIFKNTRLITDLDFAIIDFGAMRTFKTNKSKFIKKQMASAAFSPPELIDRKYGKKNDIWAFGVISYLVMVNKFFFKADGVKLFVNENPKIIENNIKKEFVKFRKNIIPTKFKRTHTSDAYLSIFKTDFNMDILKDFFLKVFTINYNNRPDTEDLLNHKLFSLI